MRPIFAVTGRARIAHQHAQQIARQVRLLGIVAIENDRDNVIQMTRTGREAAVVIEAVFGRAGLRHRVLAHRIAPGRRAHRREIGVRARAAAPVEHPEGAHGRNAGHVAIGAAGGLLIPAIPAREHLRLRHLRERPLHDRVTRIDQLGRAV